MRWVLASLMVGSCLATIGLAQAETLENRALRVDLQSSDASFKLTDKSTGVVWAVGPPQVVLDDRRGQPVRVVGGITQTDEALTYHSDFGLDFRLRLVPDPPAVEYSVAGAFQSPNRATIREVRLFQDSLPIGPGDENYYAVPHRMGIWLRAEGEKRPSRRLGYSNGCSMAMMGAVQKGSALLVSWDSPEAFLLVDHAVQPRPRLSAGIAFQESGRAVQLQPLGRGGYVEIARAYREIARQRGLLKTLAEKIKDNPAVEKLLGAADFKPFVFERLKPKTPWNRTDKEIVRVGYSFDEAARLAEHWKQDLGIDRSLLVLAGWVNKGYDNQHPDILPAAAELGGNPGLADCSRRVKAQGWLFGLHDNYQDLYREAPSWSEDLVVKNRDGSLAAGGVWAGGQAYFICARKSLELIARPQNLSGVRGICAPDVYFIDTVFASPPRPCYDPKHPETRADDIRNKQVLCDLVRRQGILFGSEEGFEWGVAHADYFEGILSHKKQSHANRAETVIPLFELVYGDAIPMYTHQSDRLAADNPDHVLDCILYAEMPVYHFGNRNYWVGSRPTNQRLASAADARFVFARGSRFGRIDQFIKNTYEVLSPLNRVTGLLPMTDHRFLTADHLVESTRFGDNVQIVVNYSSADYKTPNALLPPHGFVIESPTFVACYARSLRGKEFAEPTFLVVHSLDDRPLESSGRLRLYRGFGDHQIHWNGKSFEMDGELIVTSATP